MGYEYNHSIQFDLDHLTQYEDVSDLEEKKMELDEVYRKAKAFDEIKDYLSRPSPIDEDRDEVQKIIGKYDKEGSQ